MNTQLIPVESRPVGSATIPTVDARELHAFLENGDQFDKWIKNRIEQYEFVENQDFATYRVNALKGRPRIDYALTLSMGKELSMVERNTKGKQARQYFLECERRAKNPAIELTRMDLIRLAMQSEEERLLLSQRCDQLTVKVDILAPKADLADRLSGLEGSLCIRNAAKALRVKVSVLTHHLLMHKWAFRNKRGKLEGYATHVPRYVDHKVHPIPTDADSERVSLQLLITAEGLTRLAKVFNTAERQPALLDDCEVQS